MASSILVGLDGRDAAWRALQRGLSLCGYGSRLAVCVVHGDARDPESRTHEARAVLAQAERRLMDQLACASVHEATGDPAAELARLARELDADLLVVGHNNGSKPRPNGLGSVSERLMREPPCDVLVVR